MDTVRGEREREREAEPEWYMVHTLSLLLSYIYPKNINRVRDWQRHGKGQRGREAEV